MSDRERCTFKDYYGHKHDLACGFFDSLEEAIPELGVLKAKMTLPEGRTVDRAAPYQYPVDRERLRWEMSRGLAIAPETMRRALAELDAKDARLQEYEAALQWIKDRTVGQVCEQYEICTHPPCAASYAAYAKADEVLAHLQGTATGNEEEQG